MALLLFIVLQVLDGATTWLFLRNGVHEANPLIRGLIATARQPEAALALAKAVAIGLAVYAWRSRRVSLLWRMNVVFTACVVWNTVALFRS
jgi:hypothetical protein